MPKHFFQDMDCENSDGGDGLILELDSPRPLAPEILQALRLKETELNELCFGKTNQMPAPKPAQGF